MFVKEVSREDYARMITEDCYSSFSYSGALAVVDHLIATGYDDDLTMVDVIAIRSEFCEYTTALRACRATLFTDDSVGVLTEEQALRLLFIMDMVVAYEPDHYCVIAVNR